MNPKIEQAIKNGEAILAAKQKAEADQEAQKRREAAAYEQRQDEIAIIWVEEKLPLRIEECTAKGQRYWRTTDIHISRALEKAGWKVKPIWHERAMDEGFDYGSYWEYEITW